MTDHKNSDFDTESMGEGPSKGKFVHKIERLGSFKIEKELSSGGGGTVYLAYDESMKRRVALKVLHPSLGITQSAQTRFAREAWIAGQLEHGNIIKVYSRGEENQLNYIALEFAEGGSLSEYIKQLRIEAQKTKDFTTTANKEHIKSIAAKFVELGNALEYIHSRGFIHRDIKPQNILLAGESKQFKLTDFGIAHAEDMTRMTKKGDFIGTIHYMSPEQITAHRTTVDNRTDIYSLGVTIYEALTLSLPFEADSEEKLISEIISGHYIPARKRIRSIPKDLETILMKATNHDASRRYQTAKEFAEDLQRFLDDKPIVARPDSIFYKTGKALSLRKRVNQVALVILILIVSAGFVLTGIQQDQYDKEKILTTLKRTVETKTSPFEFEPDWPRLSRKLYDHIKNDQVDSTTIWFLKTTSIPEFYYQKYSLLEKAVVNFVVGRTKVFESELLTDSDLLEGYSQFTLLGAKEGSDSYTMCYGYENTSTAGLAASFGLADYLPDAKPGEIHVEIMSIHSHFPNAKLYERVPANNDERDNTVTMKSANGETLKKIGHRCVRSKPETDPKIVAIGNTDLVMIEPSLVDTIIDTIEVWAFESWPDDFPRRVSDSLSRKVLNENFKISGLVIVKKGISDYEVIVKGRIYDDIPIPIAGRFEILSSKDDETLLTGQLTTDFTYGGFNLEFNELKLSGGDTYYSMVWDGKFTTEIRRVHRGISKNQLINNQSIFERLSLYKNSGAVVRIIPSIDVAREFADVNKFWGDTLKFNITFQAVDSSSEN